MEGSKVYSSVTFESMIPVQEELPHVHCFCYHCVNDTRPLLKVVAPRFVAAQEKIMTDTKAFELVLKEMTKGFAGKCLVPDVFFLSDAAMIYQSKSTGKVRLKERVTNMEAKKHFEEQRKRGLALQTSQLLMMSTSFFSITEEGNPSGIGLSAAKNSSK